MKHKLISFVLILPLFFGATLLFSEEQTENDTFTTAPVINDDEWASSDTNDLYNQKQFMDETDSTRYRDLGERQESKLRTHHDVIDATQRSATEQAAEKKHKKRYGNGNLFIPVYKRKNNKQTPIGIGIGSNGG